MWRHTLPAALVLVFSALHVASASLESRLLDAQNAVRAKLGLKPFTWSAKLAQAAQEWADTLIKEGSFRHRPNSSWGQNLFEVTGGEYLPEQVVAGWAGEAKDYDLASNHCKPERICGHYTQIVWRTTREVGCAVAHGGNREVWVCEYSPPGNYVGMRPY
ncbi:MAG TPA: CAP domain-containing protein [Bryobacteraceae bacterium]|nr:CAP domain-containing protein [Bryobacteraceae bacterium]